MEGTGMDHLQRKREMQITVPESDFARRTMKHCKKKYNPNSQNYGIDLFLAAVSYVHTDYCMYTLEMEYCSVVFTQNNYTRCKKPAE